MILVIIISVIGGIMLQTYAGQWMGCSLAGNADCRMMAYSDLSVYVWKVMIVLDYLPTSLMLCHQAFTVTLFVTLHARRVIGGIVLVIMNWNQGMNKTREGNRERK